MKRILSALLLVVAIYPLAGHTSELEFTLHKIESGKPGPTLLVIGGIQGDEPGGFTAASMLVTDYRVDAGELWVVPNLNFESIIKRSRGVHGDMNRKFSSLSRTDPEFSTIEKIKSIILHPDVDLVLNLHDGSGFYSPRHVDKDENPKRWGQCIVIDQETIEAEQFGDLKRLADSAINEANKLSKNRKEQFFVKNTHTRLGNKEMAKTLTFFAIENGKPAMGVEASKNYPTHKRIEQHLRFAEALMHEIGIRFDRSFNPTARAIKSKLGRDIQLAMFDNKILFDFDTPRKRIRFVPLKKRSPIRFRTNNPLVAIVDGETSYKVRYGNRSVTTLSPEYFDYDDSLSHARFVIDGHEQMVALGTSVDVHEYFSVEPLRGRRVNVIGYRHPEQRNETGLVIRKNQISSKFSVDRQARRYRVEFYKDEKYSGMVLVNFPERRQVSSVKPANELARVN